ATGHYATILKNNDKFELIKGEDETKDQSYVLFNLNQKVLKKLKLPVGIYPKTKIREIASEFGLINADKPDSQDICFIPDRDYKKYIDKKVKKTEGNIINSSGEILGEHDGIHNFTIGQRKGLGVESNGKPLFVTNIYSDSNNIEVGPSKELMKKNVLMSSVNFISGEKPSDDIKLEAKIRYKSFPASGRLVHSENGDSKFIFDEPQRAITPGQALVFYKKNMVLGGGFIEFDKSSSKYISTQAVKLSS
ncbi:MAG: tRNA methyl transferase PRC-barrel domain-containing protein, partial [Chloroflexota bacterium]|nr:tRNA methyl transferase PRC-barrel domain-containing protein [Chloroflexota bacterium]